MKYSINIVNKITNILQYLSIDEGHRVKLSDGYTLKMDECGNLMYVCWRDVGVESDHEICANEISYGTLYDEAERISEEEMRKYEEAVALHKAIHNTLKKNNRRDK